MTPATVSVILNYWYVKQSVIDKACCTCLYELRFGWMSVYFSGNRKDGNAWTGLFLSELGQ